MSLRFDGRPLQGYAGDTLASALLAQGVRVVARSFKFRRPRGLFTCGVEEPNALLQLGTGAHSVPWERATMVDLSDGLQAFSQAGWPGVRLDFGRVLDFAPSIFAAGFYNRTFMWPSWHAYEWLIRRMGGHSVAPTERDPDRYDSYNLHCDVLVVGAGAAGLRAASAAAGRGERLVLVEQSSALGGRCAWDGSTCDGMAGEAWVAAKVQQLQSSSDVRILRRTTAVGCYDHNVIALVERVVQGEPSAGASRERFWTVRAARIVLACGSIEQPLVFSNNDRPGVMLAGAVHEYLQRYAVAAGRRVLIATNNDSAYLVARDLKRAGVDVVAVCDSRAEAPPELRAELQAMSIPLLAASMPIDTSGFGALRSVKVGRLSAAATSVESVRHFSCDVLAVSGGWNPTLHLYSHAGGKLRYCQVSGALRAGPGPDKVELAGDVAAQSAAAIGPRISPIGPTERQWVDLRHDVTVADLQLAVRENYSTAEHMKRYTTLGMSVDQGKTSAVAAIEVASRLRSIEPAAFGNTTLRPPYMPVTLGAIAGRNLGPRFAPFRRSPLYEWQREHGALIFDFGEWKRSAVYLRPGESRAEAMSREVRAARNAAAIFDGSPLGKIEIHGPDAREFLDRFYINDLSTLKPGVARYCIMLRESGVLFDDGTVVMLAPDHLLVTTTSSNAARVATWLEEWHQCEWPHMRVAIVPVTQQWATLSLTGPRARAVLSQLDCDTDLAAERFAHLHVRECRLLGARARIYRVSFTGELTYEINVPADDVQRIWHAVLKAGESHELQPLGMDGLLLLRLEKGYLHIGTDTDGTTVPDDVGWGQVAAKKARDFIGRRSLSLPEHVRPDRLQLVGLVRDCDTFVVGSHLRYESSIEKTDGWITSAGRGVRDDAPIALALLRGGRRRTGAYVEVHDAGRRTKARVVTPPFYDPTGERAKG